MPTYVYEIIPDNPSQPSDTFEYKQGMNDKPISVHPETGQPVRRVVTGGFILNSSVNDSSGGSSCCNSGSCCS
ncbi:MAG: hypothetical protein CMI64_11225 [Pedosphaera sp.]|nr:hypothetical protein [Pedosphaera sp.]MAN30135.1 hypothetical protein [Pedosphaera sp.]